MPTRDEVTSLDPMTHPEREEALAAWKSTYARQGILSRSRGYGGPSPFMQFLQGWVAARETARAAPARPLVICLCGSTRFAAQMNVEAERLTLEGAIVVRPEVIAYSRERDQQFVAPEVKARLDELHLRKIDLADEVLVVNLGGYVGESTSREIAYAKKTGKPVRFTEPASGAPTTCPNCESDDPAKRRVRRDHASGWKDATKWDADAIAIRERPDWKAPPGPPEVPWYCRHAFHAQPAAGGPTA